MAFAQETAQQVEEIVVTAQKRAENIQDIPKFVSVATQEQLADAGVSKIQDLSRLIPSIAGATSPFNGTPSIRGISSFAISIGVQGQTGVVVDDVPQPTFSSLANDLTDIERVEVLAGPQSTLSGRNAAGGLINIVTKAPSRTFAADLNVEQSSDRQTRLDAFVTGPLTSDLAFSLSGFLNRWDGPLTNIGENGLRVGGFDTKGIRGKLLWAPNDKFTATLSGYALRNETLGAAVLSAGPFVSVAPGTRFLFDAQGRTFEQLFPGITPSKDNTEFNSARHTRSRTYDRGGTLRLEYDFGGVGVLTSLTSYSKADLPRTENFFGLPLTGLVIPVGDPYTHVDYETSYKTQEFRLTSPGDQPVTYLLGAIYSDTDTNHPYVRLGYFPVNWLRQSSIKSAAAFGRATWQFLPSDSITGGLRYQSDKLNYDWTFRPLAAGGATTVRQGDSSYDFWSGELSYKHDFSQDVNAYVTIARSETGEAYDFEDNASALSPSGLQPLASEKVTNYEAGIKSQWLDRRLTLNANLFLAKYDHYQIQTLTNGDDPSAPPTIRLFAIGKIETRGVELTGAYRATDHLSLGVNAAYLDAEIKDYPNAPCYPRQTAAGGCDPQIGNLQRNLAGSRMPSTPKFRYVLSGTYRIELPEMPFDAELGAFYRHQGKVKFDVLGNPRLAQGGYGVLNLSASLRDRAGRYTLTAFVNNVLDKTYYAGLTEDPFFNGPALTAAYARDSFRYGGVRLGLSF